MRSLFLFLSLMLVFLSTAYANQPTENVHERARLVRFLATSLTDGAFNPSDAEEIHRGNLTYEQLIERLLASPAHERTIIRFFKDMVPIGANGRTIPNAYFLTKDLNDVYFARYLYGFPNKTETFINAQGQTDYRCPTTAGFTMVNAWWLPDGQTIKLCNTMASTQLYFTQVISGTPIRRYCNNPGFITRDECGCGANQLFCQPHHSMSESNILYTTEAVQNSLENEFAHTGLHAYRNSLNWNAVFASQDLIGNKFNFYSHLLEDKIMVDDSYYPPSAQDLQLLRSLPIDTIQPISTTLPGLARRGGLVTTIAFLKEYQNTRARIRRLSQSLLCEDVGAFLNTDNYMQWVNNPNLTPDIREHGENPSCSSCHYPMDNMGATLSPWRADGSYRATDSTGYSFGLATNNSRQLMEGFVERGPGFKQCMSRKVWEFYAQTPWSQLNDESKNRFIDAARSGPRALIQSIIRSKEFLDVRKK